MAVLKAGVPIPKRNRRSGEITLASMELSRAPRKEGECVMQLLKQIRLAGWKSIADQTIELQSLNVAIGSNGAGKSNIIAFF